MAGLKTKKERFGNVELETIYRETRKPYAIDESMRFAERRPHSDLESYCPPLNASSYLIEGNIECDQDVPVILRDGTIIYADIYRPAGETNVPSIIRM